MIAPAVGAPTLGDELERGAKGDVEVIVAGDLGSMIDGPEPEPGPGPGLGQANTTESTLALPAGGVVR
jgi:hypothetical protein